MDYLQQTIGFFSLLLLGALFSTNFRKIKLGYVASALLIQFILAILLIKLPFITRLFEMLSIPPVCGVQCGLVLVFLSPH